MLSRFLDKKNQTEGGNIRVAEQAATSQPGGGQGSLLDLMDPGTSAVSPGNASFANSAPTPVGAGSLLTELGNVEAQQRLYQQQMIAEREARQSGQRIPEPRFHHRQPISQSPPTGYTSQAEQLDLLAEELDSLKSRLRPESRVAQPQESGLSQADHRPPRSAFSSAFSFDNFVGSLARSWKVVVMCALIGALLTAVYSLSLPDKYQSIAEVLIEPRGLKVLNNSVSPNGLNSEATVAYAESQVRIMTSSSVVDPVIEDLELMEDPEFTGGSIDLPLLGTVARLLNSDPTGASKRESVKRYLFDNMYVRRVSQTFTIEIAVTTTDPAKSARIANALARSYIADESGARSSVARLASEDLTSRLDELRQQVRINEENVEKYKAANGLVDANGRLVSEVQLSRLNEQLVLAKVQAGDAKTRAEQAAKADLGDVISGSLPSALNNTTVSQLRLDYSRANARLEKLATKLGQRHPDRIAAVSERRSVLNAISQELKRVVQTAQENYKRAKARQDDLTIQVTQLKAAAVNDSAAKVKLRELNRQVEASRQVYESFLLRSRETGEQENIRSSSARVISEAVPIAEKAGPQRKLMVLFGGLAGAGVGIAFAFIPLFMVGFRQMHQNGAAQDAPAWGSDAPTQVTGDLYSSGSVPVQSGNQLPLPGLQQPPGRAPADHAPQRHSAPPMYYENWRR